MRQTAGVVGRGQIVTFYSLEEGTGRTMALANVAWILACNGKQVLAVDWDLESPDLHRYFAPFLVDKELRHSPGVIDIIREFAAAAVSPHAELNNSLWYRRYADVEREAVSLGALFPRGGVIDFLPAGQQDTSYSSAVCGFDWDAFFDRLSGSIFLDELRADMRKRYDYILIDSRTRLNDTAGICTVNMPDTVVECFTLHQSSIDGAASVAKSILELRLRRDERLRLLPVAMRVGEDGDLPQLPAYRDYARQKFEPVLSGDLMFGPEIPFHPTFVSRTTLSAFDPDASHDGSLLSAFTQLTRVIANASIVRPEPMPDTGDADDGPPEPE